MFLEKILGQLNALAIPATRSLEELSMRQFFLCPCFFYLSPKAALCWTSMINPMEKLRGAHSRNVVWAEKNGDLVGLLYPVCQHWIHKALLLGISQWPKPCLLSCTKKNRVPFCQLLAKVLLAVNRALHICFQAPRILLCSFRSFCCSTVQCSVLLLCSRTSIH